MDPVGFSVVDYVVFGIFVMVPICIGLYFAVHGNQKTSNFLMADRQLDVVPTALSLFVTMESAIYILGVSAEMYMRGWVYALSAVGICLGYLTGALFYVPMMYPHGFTSIYEYYERRYDSAAVRRMVFGLDSFKVVLYLGFATFAPATAIQSVIPHFPTWASILISAALPTVYTAMGGIKAVVWIDVFQYFILMAGIIAALVQGVMTMGGLGNVWEYCSTGQRLGYASFSLDPRKINTVWGLVIGTMLSNGQVIARSQISFQRFGAQKSLGKAQAMVLLVIPCHLIATIILVLSGLVMYSVYAKQKCDPLLSKNVSTPNQVFPFYFLQLFQNLPGFSGFFMATLFSGSTSTVSSLLSAISGVVWEDIFKKPCANVSPKIATAINRIIVIVFGCIAVGVAFLLAAVKGPLIQVTGTVLGVLTGPLTGSLVLASWFRWANWKGALIGNVFGVCLMTFIVVGSQRIKVTKQYLPYNSIDGCMADINNSTFIMTNNSSPSMDVYHSIATAIPDGTIIEEKYSIVVGGQNNSQDGKGLDELQGLENLFAVTYLWYGTLGVSVTVFVGLLGSLATGGLRNEVDTKYLVNWRHCCFWKNENFDMRDKNTNKKAAMKEGYCVVPNNNATRV